MFHKEKYELSDDGYETRQCLTNISTEIHLLVQTISLKKKTLDGAADETTQSRFNLDCLKPIVESALSYQGVSFIP